MIYPPTNQPIHSFLHLSIYPFNHLIIHLSIFPSNALLGLANPVDSANGLHLAGWVQDWFHQEHMGSLDDVQPLAAGVDGKEEGSDVWLLLEVH